MKNIFIRIIMFGAFCAAFCVTAINGEVFAPIMYLLGILIVLLQLSGAVREHIGKMKLVALLLCLCCFSARADGPTTNDLWLTWDVLPQYSTNDTFYIYSSTNVAQPMSQWVAVTSITFKAFMVGTNVPIAHATDVLRFYTFVSSNFTGRSDFAEPDSCRRLPSGTGTRIGSGKR